MGGKSSSHARGGEKAPASSSFPPEVELYATSDIHTDFPENFAWIEALPFFGPHSALIVAGDVSDDLHLLHRTLSVLKTKFADVAFVPGNHELWLRAAEATNSFQKYRRIVEICESIGVLTKPAWVCRGRVLLVPLPSWYDGSLHCYAPWEGAAQQAQLKSGAPVDHHFECWRDTTLCQWPSDAGTAASPALTPAEVVAHFHKEAAANVAAALRMGPETASQHKRFAVSFSHFYSSTRQLEPLMAAARAIKPSNNGRYPPNFTSIAGSAALQPLIDALAPAVHVCGHSHRAFDFSNTPGGTRYVNAPLAYPSERSAGLIPPQFESGGPLRL